MEGPSIKICFLLGDHLVAEVNLDDLVRKDLVSLDTFPELVSRRIYFDRRSQEGWFLFDVFSIFKHPG